MTMSHNGLTKLIEECSEASQVAAKMIAFPDTDQHPDGAGSLRERLTNEIADVLAAVGLVIENFNLDQNRLMERAEKKRELFRKWHDDKTV